MIPTPHTDPTGLAALVGVLATAIVVAVGVDGAWGPVVGAAVPLLAIVFARSRAWAPDSHDAAVNAAEATVLAEDDRLELEAEIRADIGPFVRPPPVVGPGHAGPLP